MPSFQDLLTFSLLALGLVATPGPNMIYLVSRTLSQGRKAGFVSYAGVVTGSVFYLACAALGITTLLFAIPYAYDALRFAGAIYLGYLAWQTLRKNGPSAFQLQDLPADSPRRLYIMGFLTNLLNPKQALFFLAVLPQFIDAQRGSIVGQFLLLGALQIAISMVGNTLIMLAAARAASALQRRSRWRLAQRWIMGTVLAGLSAKLALQSRS
ncbi:threonine/homoserine/homoserine lactone efflux protein [Variovorax boronicumulans]|uniref:LysE family translocator n=1 Tax=Variovorax boronicumulans TaxID=436515 RepID=UPI0027894C6A|nr:LysE family translocator [Variovorax boronicumulans]MDQ0015904.1 threonine/homoserine/homoserine lactone efflux protein [Variovorax boronicumulans]